MVPYNEDVTLELLPEMDNLKPYMEQNKLYIRLASNEMFRISKEVVHLILNGEIKSAEEALSVFNQKLAEGEPGTTGIKLGQYLTECLVEQGNQLEAPTDYITLR